jgi:RimJ/RimL family protein N-acetyltransferase
MIETDRLILRSWRPADLQPFAAMNADPRVCEFLPKVLAARESDELADRIMQHFENHGFGLWAVERKSDERFIGFTGLYLPSFEAHFTPCVEIGWRFAFAYWRKGYATEAAIAAKAYAFGTLKLQEFVAYTAVVNFRSRAVMERIAMTCDPADAFDHPALPRGHRLAPHVLYRSRSPFAAASI